MARSRSLQPRMMGSSNVGTSSSASATVARAAHDSEGAASAPLVSARKVRRESGCGIGGLPKSRALNGATFEGDSGCSVRFDFAVERFDDFGEGLGADVALAAMTDGNGAGFGFLGADHEHIGNFLELRVADFCGQLFVAIVEMDAEVVALQSFGDMFGVIDDFFADRTNFDLHGREPQRESAGVVLDQDAEEALDGAEQGAVDHERLMLGAVVGDVLQAEARGEVEVELHGGELPGTADGVDELHIDFRAVEGRFAFHFFVRNVHALHGVSESGGGAMPDCACAAVSFRSGGGAI